MNNLFVSITMSESDKKSLIFVVVVLILALLLFALIGAAIRAAMNFQASKADELCSDVARTQVISVRKKFRLYCFRKNARTLYYQSLIPVLLSLIFLLVWVIANIATGDWNHNIFVEFSELFPVFDFEAEGVIVKFWGLDLLASFPPMVSGPRFTWEHLPSYIEVLGFATSWTWLLVVIQSFLSRAFRFSAIEKKFYGKSLENVNPQGDVPIVPKQPLGPSDH